MIQRIQTVYLLLSIVCAIVLSTLLTAATIDITGDSVLQLTICGKGLAWSLPASAEVPELSIKATLLPIAAIAIGVLLRFSAIFLYHNRKLQIRLCYWAIFTDLLWCAIVAILSYDVIQFVTKTAITDTQISCAPGLGLIAFALTICFTLLSIRGIRHDERLVRAADRLR
ncbi:MAG: DUF4293 domain-containing protein [Bacteroidaceae bacterium]|nr:DUF4293 domain-containing protein [Bacteroidaceae bacterium]